jgi:transcriptional regulator with XRE-family HTH domain
LIDAAGIQAVHLADDEFRAQWEAQAPAHALALLLVQYRLDFGLTQTAPSRLLDMKQPAIARLECGEHIPTLATLFRIAEVLEIELLVDIKPSAKSPSWIAPTADNARIVERVTTARGSEITILAS